MVENLPLNERFFFKDFSKLVPMFALSISLLFLLPIRVHLLQHLFLSAFCH